MEGPVSATAVESAPARDVQHVRQQPPRTAADGRYCAAHFLLAGRYPKMAASRERTRVLVVTTSGHSSAILDSKDRYSPTSDKEEEALVTQRIRAFLLVEVVAFAGAGLVHLGLLVHGYQHRQARVAESVITLVLLVGLVLSWLRPTWTREAGLVAQGFALLGTLVGSFTIIVGVGPRTAPDVVYHIAIMAVLVWGLLVAMRSPANSTSQPREVGP